MNENGSLPVTTTASKGGGRKGGGTKNSVAIAENYAPVLHQNDDAPVATKALPVEDDHHHHQTTAVTTSSSPPVSPVVSPRPSSSTPPPPLICDTTTSSSFLPPELVDLFEVSSFVGCARPYSKPCFRSKTYVSKDSWVGALYRRFYGENAMYGAMTIQRIAERLASALKNYKGQVWESAIRRHMVDFMKGVKIIQETYHDYTDVIPIFSTSLLIVDHSLNL